MRALKLLLLASLVLPGCDSDRSGGGTMAVGIIGDRTGQPSAMMTVTDEGLVRLDREGQVIPGAAARWAILDDGLDYIFRIDDAAGLPASTVAKRLREALRKRQDADFAALDQVESIEAVTSTVVEMRLSVPQPDLLPLLARPELSVGAPTSFKIDKLEGTTDILLGARQPGDAVAPIRLQTRHVGRAVLEFQADTLQFVTGGTFADLPVVRTVAVERKALRFDPATGLFGLAIRNATLSPAARTALSLSIDRDRIVTAMGVPNHTKATTVAGSTLEPPLIERRASAGALLNGQPLHVRVAMPSGPGATLMFAYLAQDWARIGISAERVALRANDADLVLVDRVAPPATLAILACAVSTDCDPKDRLALIDPPFIPIASPVRWSLVSPRLDLFTENGLAVHPLDQLRSRH